MARPSDTVFVTEEDFQKALADITSLPGCFDPSRWDMRTDADERLFRHHVGRLIRILRQNSQFIVDETLLDNLAKLITASAEHYLVTGDAFPSIHLMNDPDFALCENVHTMTLLHFVKKYNAKVYAENHPALPDPNTSKYAFQPQPIGNVTGSTSQFVSTLGAVNNPQQSGNSSMITSQQQPGTSVTSNLQEPLHTFGASSTQKALHTFGASKTEQPLMHTDGASRTEKQSSFHSPDNGPQQSRVSGPSESQQQSLYQYGPRESQKSGPPNVQPRSTSTTSISLQQPSPFTPVSYIKPDCSSSLPSINQDMLRTPKASQQRSEARLPYMSLPAFTPDKLRSMMHISNLMHDDVLEDICQYRSHDSNGIAMISRLFEYVNDTMDRIERGQGVQQELSREIEHLRATVATLTIERDAAWNINVIPQPPSKPIVDVMKGILQNQSNKLQAPLPPLQDSALIQSGIQSVPRIPGSTPEASNDAIETPSATPVQLRQKERNPSTLSAMLSSVTRGMSYPFG